MAGITKFWRTKSPKFLLKFFSLHWNPTSPIVAYYFSSSSLLLKARSIDQLGVSFGSFEGFGHLGIHQQLSESPVLGWKIRCAELCRFSCYFEGSRSSIMIKSADGKISDTLVNGGLGHHKDSNSVNGKLETFKDLII
ncbi:uncharacterized protein LOC113328000 [Papaver somniferum]|uniref:uncharacterized protein LOC113328000 n=1 Tax=Papaver somniferum TaxID=3469 RepID=UPI000E6F5F5F|nr:uncharacterized protein LOC113328000 [Papaver somniferum]